MLESVLMHVMLRLKQVARLGLAPLLLALLQVPSVSAAPADQVGSGAPENLRCPGNPAPALPGPDWRAEPVWAWEDFARVDGVIGSNDGPFAVAVDSKCNVYITDSQHFGILKLDRTGARVGGWSMPGERAAGESSSPRGIAVDVQGNVYASDTPRDRVYKFSPQGQVVHVFGDCPGGGSNCDAKLPGRFISPEGLAVDGAGNLYVAEAAGGRIQKFSPAGQPQAVWDLSGKGLGDLFIPGSLSLDQGGFLYMTEAYNNWVVKFDPGSGAIVGRWGGQQSGDPGQLHGPLGVGVDAGGSLYVSDAGNWRVQKLGPDGGFQTQWRNCLDGDPPCQFPDAGADPGQFMASRGIAVDGQGTVYVADTANKRVERLVITEWQMIPPPEPVDQG
jgi:DNA-binding beta-propeller fold protein YncE